MSKNLQASLGKYIAYKYQIDITLSLNNNILTIYNNTIILVYITNNIDAVGRKNKDSNLI